MTVSILHGDCRDELATRQSASIDSVVTDPPYALVSISKRFGAENAVPVKEGVYARAGKGFMGKTWDNGEAAFAASFWAEVLRVLKPGGHVLAFGGTRTYHRLACAIEDAGFEIRDQIGWAYGSGFPKSHNQHDEWEGWGTALKPAWEPIVVARKPLIGTVAENLGKWGVGALNIDGCRVLGGESTRRQNTAEMGYHGGNVAEEYRTGSDLGRWPANLIHDGSDEVISAFHAKAAIGSDRRKDQNVYGTMTRGSNGAPPRLELDKSAARFFYCAKASRADRDDGLVAQNPHPTVKPTDLMRYLCRLVTPPGGTVLDPFMGSGSTGRGAVIEGFNFIGIEQDATYVKIAAARVAKVTPLSIEEMLS